MLWLIASTIVAAGMATAMIFVRLRAAKKPASVKKIILPPFMMSTGALMFVFPMFRVQWSQVFEAVMIGAIFSIFLIRTSKFEVRDGDIYLKPSKAFIGILFGLLILRIILKLIVGHHVSFGETSGMFFLLAFGMIMTWRIAMLKQFLHLEKKMEPKKDLA
ncbi:Membrane protein CcdC involved in cytochrome C biogenesis [Halobacillus karajensis]|uniref:Membrane protein involved in cytochrome C biogenesis n=1 Tax=Halobacillus karajensis TaxID=195088 RepID=A0A024P1C3_9BACI|nr:cytochrome c biogenesis protein CcdC [Halobacillus karajensis]CDQ19629.1 Membrane protein involved in cytochrome C biogenesis [Halobacillus karajensis]CDQ22089.1 Membrane protein involved in cytochrome C biogenesis [Halobacillus karajensis]CDQ27930.1 Membrane protein involved in cytochrome C biogenesis [Halobacillus karajensis]SEH79258.1 Membrane protein CcdC involved in cytochrome C biogenesis [Halobacillus karajensis]